MTIYKVYDESLIENGKTDFCVAAFNNEQAARGMVLHLRNKRAWGRWSKFAVYYMAYPKE